MNGQIPNSQVDLAGQPKRILKSGENGCAEIKVISEATAAKHKNYVRKDKGVTPEVPAEGKPRNNTSTKGGVKPEVPAHGKPRDDTSAQSHNFKRKINGAKTGKYMKTNGGARRPMESSKLDTNSRSASLAVCLNCGDVGFQETLVFCKKCQVYAIHRYCLDGPVIFTADVNWFCDCEPEVVDTSAKNVSLNSANISSQNSSERVKNKQGQQNMEAKTMALLSDNHSLSHHGLSQCSNNTEKEEFGKECQPALKDEANNTEGSMILTVPHPIADPVWRGSLRLSCPSIHTVLRLLAHMSTLACSKVLEEAKLFPDVLCPDLLSRTAVWPKSFMNCGPNDDSISLYFFPDTESVEKSYDKLVDHMMSGDLAIRAVVKNADLLIFPSVLLPIQCRRFQEKYYLWGVFRAKKT